MVDKSLEAYEINEAFEDCAVTEPPFPESAQLCDELNFDAKELSLRHRTDKFFKQARLPGLPQVELHDIDRVISQAANDVCTPNFDSLTRGWWPIRKNSERIHSISEYGMINCKLVVTEDPELHCVWDDDRIFIKPIPVYLTSYAFWSFVLQCSTNDSPTLLAAACGLLRSYATLIRRPSDFALAQRALLIPSEWTFSSFMIFLSHFAPLSDALVSLRYTVGAVQLQTLNANMFCRRGRMYYRIHRYRYNAYFSRYYGPTLFVFATFSVALSAMQVALAVRQAEAPMDEARGWPEAGNGGGLGGSWKHMGYAFRWFSIWSISFAVSMAAILLGMFMFFASLDAFEATKARWKEKKARRK
jgi:hypothetical protein